MSMYVFALSITLLLVLMAVVVIGFDHMMYTVNEDGEYVEITFGIQNATQMSSTMEVDVLFQAEGNSAMCEC